MTKIFLIVFPLLLSVGISQNKVNINNLVQYGDKMFEENDNKPYTGRVFDLYESTGKKIFDGKYRNGLKNGKWVFYSDNGVQDKMEVYEFGDIIKTVIREGNELKTIEHR